jgi:uncharacterized protein YuzE
MRFDLDPDADAIYITLRDEAFVFGEDLDHARHIDFGADRIPIGVELLNVSRGVNVVDLPDQERIAQLLHQHGIVVRYGAALSA